MGHFLNDNCREMYVDSASIVGRCLAGSVYSRGLQELVSRVECICLLVCYYHSTDRPTFSFPLKCSLTKSKSFVDINVCLYARFHLIAASQRSKR